MAGTFQNSHLRKGNGKTSVPPPHTELERAGSMPDENCLKEALEGSFKQA